MLKAVKSPSLFAEVLQGVASTKRFQLGREKRVDFYLLRSLAKN
ncbi:hypothetical protein [Coleofasciculus sp. FACHB-1120]|nr:hypothetical protein [Coleofasciculus sp. FACHB-1120]